MQTTVTKRGQTVIPAAIDPEYESLADRVSLEALLYKPT